MYVEHEKLRIRLANASKNAIEYRMTITEARILLLEFDSILRASTQIIESKPIGTRTNILDGGEL